MSRNCTKCSISADLVLEKWSVVEFQIENATEAVRTEIRFDVHKEFSGNPGSGVYLHKDVRADRIEFHLHKEFGVAGSRFYLHKEFLCVEILCLRNPRRRDPTHHILELISNKNTCWHYLLVELLPNFSHCLVSLRFIFGIEACFFMGSKHYQIVIAIIDDFL